MARFWIATLVLAACGNAASPAPEDPSIWVQLQPGSYTVYTRCYFPKWQLTADSQPVDLEDVSPGFTFTCNSRPRFHFAERGDWLNVYRHNELWEPFARIPLSLQAGMTWDDSGRCAVEGDEFRVTFTVNGKVQTMVFSRADGLVSWDGMDRGTVQRMPSPLQAAAKGYAAWGRIDDEFRVAPTLCRAPMPPQLRMSASLDEATHGRKQYYLFAKYREAYLHARDLDQPDEQVIVKESWLPGMNKGPLYLMMKWGGEWTYATASPDGKTIVSQGKLASCIECHESSRTRDRLFGVRSCASAK